MLSQYLQSVTGIEGLGIVSLIAAVTAFAGVVVYAFRLDRNMMKAMAALPLESDTPPNDGLDGRRP